MRAETQIVRETHGNLKNLDPYLEQETVASLLLDGGLDTEGVGDGQIITNDLDTTTGGEVSPGLPVILLEGVLNGDNGVLLDI